MPYSKEFNLIISTKGMPQLNEEQFRRFMNIVFLEGRLQEAERVRDGLVNSSTPHAYDLKVSAIRKEITRLTGDVRAQELLEEMVRRSQ